MDEIRKLLGLSSDSSIADVVAAVRALLGHAPAGDEIDNRTATAAMRNRDDVHRQDFRRSPALQAEFGDVETFIAFKQYEGRQSRSAAHREAGAPRRPLSAYAEELLFSAFKASRELQDEFGGDEAAYLAFVHAKQLGGLALAAGR